MNLSLMRKIDLFVGKPLCLFFTLIHKLLNLFHKENSKKQKQIDKILLIKLSEMGALTLTQPLLSYLKNKYPQAKIYFLVFQKNVSVLKLLKNSIEIKNIYLIQDNSLFALIKSTIKSLTKIRKENIDIVIDLEFFSRLTSLIAYLSGATKSVGFYRYHFEGLYRGDLLTHKVQYNPLLHCSRSYLSLGKVLDLPYMDTPQIYKDIKNEEIISTSLDPIPEAMESLYNKLSPYELNNKNLYLISPGDGLLALREWPLENFILLTKKILENKNNVVLIIGQTSIAGKDIQLCSALNNPRCINLVDQTSMDELLSLFHIAKALITNDCGLPHLASLTPLQKFVIFGPESPLIFAPVGKNTHIIYSNHPCSPCLSALNHRNSSCQDNQCLKVITVENIYHLITSQIGS